MALKRGGWSVGCLRILPAWIEFRGAQQPCRNVSVAGAGCAQAGHGAGARQLAPHGILCCSCVPALQILPPCVTSQVHKVTPAAAPPRHPAVLAHRAASSLLSPLCAGAVPYTSFGGSRSCSLAASLRQGVSWWSCSHPVCHLVNLIQCLTSAPNSSTEAV